jgi:type IV fimbrial biogenesis protein FimT
MICADNSSLTKLRGDMRGNIKKTVTPIGVSSGFTMVELIVVMAVLAIMAVFSVPAINSWIPSYQIREAARDLYSDFQAARSEALKRNANVVISFTTETYPTTGGSYLAFVDDGSGGGTADNQTQDGSETTLFQRNMPDKCTLVSASYNGGAITGYTARGLPLGNRVGSSVVRNSRSQWYRLALTNAGYGKIQKSDDGATWE